uniref:ATP synthase F0 subunit 8 n=1 Tax=Romanomermis culicivorax TaxID=13658 RepID=A0A915LC94_ROMCU
MTKISLMINSFLGCCDKFICLMATSAPVLISMALTIILQPKRVSQKRRPVPTFIASKRPEMSKFWQTLDK